MTMKSVKWVAVGLVLAFVASGHSSARADSADKALAAVLNQFKADAKAAAPRPRPAPKVAAASCPDKTGVLAFSYAKRLVKAQLKAPRSAKFPWTPINLWGMGNCSFKVASYVDAQNSFGALIRTNWIAEIQYSAASDTWKLLNLDFQ